ncbi:DNA photolyase family protein [Candidatus Poseidonia alphae]|nr:DNA photolyase family protein [Candidatus Poseidonia alphae]
MFENGLFIFRRDLRIQDNIGLNLSMEQCKKVYPIFIFTPEQVTNKNKFKSDNSIQFMIESLDDLKGNIYDKGGILNCYYGENNTIIRKLINKWNIDAVFFNWDITPYAKKRDASIEKMCKSLKVDYVTAQDYYLYEPGTIKSGSDEPYTKFTPYYNKVLPNKVIKPVYLKKYKFSKEIDGNIGLLEAYTKFTEPNINLLVNGGREYGEKIINNISEFKNYGKNRDNVDQHTTLLSAYLKYGNVSVRETYYKMKDKLGRSSDLLRQLIWREFYAQLLFSNPQVLGNPLKEKYGKIKWEKNTSNFNAWKNGLTGFPIVDAGMRELNTTGYMHNRCRLITASFLIKTLLINWEDGEKYYSTKLTDYDPASNNGNWQWVASSGADAQPYFRIFNPWSQSEKHDTDAEYIKKWIPELESVPAKDIHKWNEVWEKYSDIKYPKPIVNYDEQRKKALAMYKKVV